MFSLRLHNVRQTRGRDVEKRQFSKSHSAVWVLHNSTIKHPRKMSHHTTIHKSYESYNKDRFHNRNGRQNVRSLTHHVLHENRTIKCVANGE